MYPTSRNNVAGTSPNARNVPPPDAAAQRADRVSSAHLATALRNASNGTAPTPAPALGTASLPASVATSSNAGLYPMLPSDTAGIWTATGATRADTLRWDNVSIPSTEPQSLPNTPTASQSAACSTAPVASGSRRPEYAHRPLMPKLGAATNGRELADRRAKIAELQAQLTEQTAALDKFKSGLTDETASLTPFTEQLSTLQSKLNGTITEIADQQTKLSADWGHLEKVMTHTRETAEVNYKVAADNLHNAQGNEKLAQLNEKEAKENARERLSLTQMRAEQERAAGRPAPAPFKGPRKK